MPTKQYKGSCHCGGVLYHTEVDIDTAISCNCSMCGRSGTILSFVPKSAFHLDQGEELLQDYQFNKKHIHHVFCRTCGIKPFAYGKDEEGQIMYAVNVRCLEGVDVHTLKPQQVDGK